MGNDETKANLKLMLRRLGMILTLDVEQRLELLKLSDDLKTVTAIYDSDGTTKDIDIEGLDIQDIIIKLSEGIKL